MTLPRGCTRALSIPIHKYLSRENKQLTSEIAEVVEGYSNLMAFLGSYAKAASAARSLTLLSAAQAVRHQTLSERNFECWHYLTME